MSVQSDVPILSPEQLNNKKILAAAINLIVNITEEMVGDSLSRPQSLDEVTALVTAAIVSEIAN
jgi:hypothetical protein